MTTAKASTQKDITERCFEFAVRVVKFCEVLSKTPGAKRATAGQLLRSGTSVGANVEEAQAAESRDDFIHKMSVAMKEARESRFWLRLAIAVGWCDAEKLTPLYQEGDALVRILATIVCRAKENHPTTPKARRKSR